MTLYRHFGTINTYTTISDDELDEKVGLLKKAHPNSGERILDGMLVAKGIRVVRRRLRESIHRVDPVETAIRWLRKTPR